MTKTPRLTQVASLSRLEQGMTEGVTLDEGLRATLSHVRDEIGERLTALFSIREDELRTAGTSVEEMIARFSLAERSEGQRASWIADQPNTMQKVFWMETERALGQEVRAELATFNLAPELTEAVAREQMLSADRHLRLSEVPALEAIVDRMQESLRPENLDRVRSGDLGPLAEHVRNPALRAAVAQTVISATPWGKQAQPSPNSRKRQNLGQRASIGDVFGPRTKPLRGNGARCWRSAFRSASSFV